MKQPHAPGSSRSSAVRWSNMPGSREVQGEVAVAQERIAAQLADLKMPGALEGLDRVLVAVKGGGTTGAEAIEQLLAAQIDLRKGRCLEAAMRSSRLP